MDKKELKSLYTVMKTLNVLYVEDDNDASEQMMDYLSELFGKVYHGKNGAEGLVLFKYKKIDFIITDIIMPKMDGFEMLKKIKLLKPNIPIFIITAYKNDKFYEEAIYHNVKGFLSKPFSLNKLVELFIQTVSEINIENEKNEKYKYLNDINKNLKHIGQKLSSEKDHNILLEYILKGSIDLTKSDGGTLYLYNKETDSLDFKIAINESLNMNYNSFANDEEFSIKSLRFYNDDNTLNRKNISVISAYEKRLINLENIYELKTYNFEGIKKFDIVHNYKTQSMLVIPLINIENELFGVIQLINKIEKNEVVPFSSDDELLLTSLSAIATMTIHNNKLISEFELLVESLAKSFTIAFNEKSGHTSKHIDNVAKLSEMLAKAINNDNTIFKNVNFSCDQLEEIKLAALFHDIGKLTIPEHIISKSQRLESLNDRIELVTTRLELYIRDIEIRFLEKKINKIEKEKEIKQVRSDIDFLKKINKKSTFVKKEDKKRIEEISSRSTVSINGKNQVLLSEDEVYHLSIEDGTLTKEEKSIIDNHVIVSYSMLKEITFPKKFKNVGKIAGSHHKTIDNQGNCHEDIRNIDMTIQDKILAIADKFEALAAKDRPYKKPYSLKEIETVLSDLADKNIIDSDIVSLIFREKVLKEYIDKNFLEEQQNNNYSSALNY